MAATKVCLENIVKIEGVYNFKKHMFLDKVGLRATLVKALDKA